MIYGSIFDLSGAELMENINLIIENKQEFCKAASKLAFRFAKTYISTAPHEYAVTNDNTNNLSIIRTLNRFIEEHPDEAEIFWNVEYKVVFVDSYKYWQVDDWNVTKILNRNWDFKNEDGSINTSITESYKI